MKKIYKNIIVVVILFYLLVNSIVSNNTVVVEFINYSKLFIYKLFPVSFIFLLLSNLLIEYNFLQIISKIFKLKSVYLYVFFLSFLSGFPSGAIYIKEFLDRGLISLRDANKIIMFTHFPNFLFVINSVSTILEGRILAYKILFSIIVANIILLILFYNGECSINENIEMPDNFSNILSNCVNKIFRLLIIIYGISVFFFLISLVVNRYVHNTFIYVLINGLFDLTKGVYSVSLISDIYIRAIFIIIFITFGSLSIHFQIKSILMDTGVEYRNFIIGRCLGTVITLFVFFLSLLF